MTKILTVLAAVCLLSLGLVADSNATGSMASGGSTACEVTDLIGTQVKNPAGEALGSITDVLIGAQGRPAIAVLYQGDVEDFDVTRHVAVPFTALSISRMEDSPATVVLNVDKEKIFSAPRFDRNRDLNDTKWATRVYRYFGQQPYWTEETKMAAPAESSP